MPSSRPQPRGPKRGLFCPRIYDPARSQLWQDHVVICRGPVIEAIVPRSEAPADFEIVSFPGTTLIPGLIDCHVHLAIDSDDYQIEFLKRSSAMNALRTLKHAQSLLAEGWTTLRVAGDADRWYAWIDVARAIEQEEFVGPQLCGAGHYISPTGGGGDLNHTAIEHCLRGDGLIADGVDAVRRAVRQECKAGSDWIKVLLSGAYMSQGDDPERTLYSTEEFAALVDEAKRWGRPVMVHAHGNDAIKLALQHNVQSIEHGTSLDQEAIDLFCAHDTVLIPTLAIGELYLDQMQDSVNQAEMIEKSRATRDSQRAWLRKAIKAGVKIAVGSDLGGYPPASAGKREFIEFVELGMSPPQALAAGTSVAARLLGCDDHRGAIAPGMQADLVICKGQPDLDIQHLHNVVDVIKSGARTSVTLRRESEHFPAPC